MAENVEFYFFSSLCSTISHLSFSPKRHNFKSMRIPASTTTYIFGFFVAMMFIKGWYTEQVMIAIAMTISAFTAFSAHQIKSGKLQIPLSNVLWIGFAFWILVISSVFTAELHFEAFIKLGLFSAMPFSFLFIAMSAPEDLEKRLTRILPAMVGIASLLAIGALIQWVFFPEMLFKGLAHYPFNNPNSLAGFLSLSFFVTIGFWLLKPQQLWRLVLPALFFIGIMTTGSRGATLFLVIMLPVLLFFTSQNLELSARLKRIGMVFAILIALFATLSVIPKAERARDVNPAFVISSTLEGSNKALWQRPMIWNTVWQVIESNPITGVGIGNLHYYYAQYKHPDDQSSGFHAHSDPLQYWAELGFLAPFLFYSFLIFGVYRTFLAVQTTDDVILRVKILTPFCALGAMMMHSHFSFNMQFINILMYAGILLGVWYRYSAIALREEPRLLNIPHWSCLAVPLCIFILVFVPAMSTYGINKMATNALRAGDIERYHDFNDLTDKLSWGQNARAHVSRADLPLLILDSMPNLNQKQKAELIAETRAHLEKASQLNPHLKDAWPRQRKFQDILRRSNR